MEPIEWLILGVGLVLGGLFGAKGKGVVKSAAKGYLIAGEKAQEWTANVREDFRDALEEARYEKEQDEAARRAEYEASIHGEPNRELLGAAPAKPSSNSRRSSAAHGGSASPSGAPAAQE